MTLFPYHSLIFKMHTRAHLHTLEQSTKFQTVLTHSAASYDPDDKG